MFNIPPDSDDDNHQEAQLRVNSGDQGNLPATWETLEGVGTLLNILQKGLATIVMCIVSPFYSTTQFSTDEEKIQESEACKLINVQISHVSCDL